MARPKIKLRSGDIRELLHDPGVEADLKSRMALVLAAAKASAPVSSGAYRDSLKLDVENRQDRVVVRVGSVLDYARTVEANTGNLSRALDAAGGSS